MEEASNPIIDLSHIILYVHRFLNFTRMFVVWDVVLTVSVVAFKLMKIYYSKTDKPKR